MTKGIHVSRIHPCTGTVLLLTSAMLLTACGTPASDSDASDSGGAADFSDVTLHVVANSRTSEPFAAWEAFAEDLEKRTDGAITAELSDMAELGFSGAEALGLVSDGLADAIEVIPGFVAGEQPIIEGVQLPGTFDGLDTSMEAWTGWAEKLREHPDIVGGHVLGSIGWECIYLWSNRELGSLSDVSGMQIRVFGEAQSDLVGALGAEPVSMPLADTYAAMERGVINGVITGATAGAALSLDEVADYLADLNLGCTGALAVINQELWDSLTDADREALTEAGKVLSATSWDVAQDATEGGVTRAEEAGVTVIPAESSWEDELSEISEDTIVANWARRSGDVGVTLFNDVLAPLSGFDIE